MMHIRIMAGMKHNLVRNSTCVTAIAGNRGNHCRCARCGGVPTKHSQQCAGGKLLSLLQSRWIGECLCYLAVQFPMFFHHGPLLPMAMLSHDGSH